MTSKAWNEKVPAVAAELDACIRAVWQWAKVIRRVAEAKRCLFICQDEASLEAVARRLEAVKRSLRPGRGTLSRERAERKPGKPGPKPDPNSVVGLIKTTMSNGDIWTPAGIYEAIKPGRPAVLLLTVQQTMCRLMKTGLLERVASGRYKLVRSTSEENDR